MTFTPYYDRKIGSRHRNKELKTKKTVGAPSRPEYKYNMVPLCQTCIKENNGLPCEGKTRCIHR